MLQHIKFCKEGLLVRHGLSIKRANEPFSSPSHQLHWVMDQSWLLAPRSCPNQPEEESIFSLVKLLEYMSSFALKQQILSKFWHVCKQMFQNLKSISFDNFVFIYFFQLVRDQLVFDENSARLSKYFWKSEFKNSLLVSTMSLWRPRSNWFLEKCKKVQPVRNWNISLSYFNSWFKEKWRSR